MKSSAAVLLALFLLVFTWTGPLRADDALFFGNSFTMGAGDPAVSKSGGVPKLVEAIATSKGKKLTTEMVAVGGKDFGFHLTQPKTDEALAAKQWKWVVLQDYSTEPTHAGNLAEHVKNAETFYKRIEAKDPGAKIVLYQTWAYAKGNHIFSEKSTKGFANPAAMTAELQNGYAKSAKRLEALEPGEQVLVAPVGTAFARCVEKYPDITLYAGDLKHPSGPGSYLAALVIYATIYEDNPRGAPHDFGSLAVNAQEAEKLQGIAAEVTNRR